MPQNYAGPDYHVHEQAKRGRVYQITGKSLTHKVITYRIRDGNKLILSALVFRNSKRNVLTDVQLCTIQYNICLTMHNVRMQCKTVGQ